MSLTDFDKELLATNLLGATTLKKLHQKEKIVTNAKMIALQNEPVVGQLDYVHLKNIHAFLFADVYSWAGKDRYEAGVRATFGKGTTFFTTYDKLPAVSTLLFDALKEEEYFRGLSKEIFVKSAASFMNGLNILHPFREGNGRVQRLFMEYVAKEAGYVLSFKEVTEQEMLKASILGAKGNLFYMEALFKKAL
jgi:cell filamentation protein